MSVNDAVRFMQNETAIQESRDIQARIQESIENRTGRNVGGTMGKNDFLKLLAAQLRYQNPLEPTNDTDFAAQLANFSSLEQMMNMNETLSVMSGHQAFSLVGKYVAALVDVDGVPMPIVGVIDSIFTEDGVTLAFITGYNEAIPISNITGILDSNTLLTPDVLIQTSNNLIGRTVKAEWNEKEYEGIVTRISVEGGFMYARIEAEDGTAAFVPVGSIYDIRQTGTPGNDPIPVEPPEDEGDGEGDGEIDGGENDIDPEA